MLEGYNNATFFTLVFSLHLCLLASREEKCLLSLKQSEIQKNWNDFYLGQKAGASVPWAKRKNMEGGDPNLSPTHYYSKQLGK